ncbi:glycosyltransferase 87 family protein [Blastococcus sp. SYSU D00669]
MTEQLGLDRPRAERERIAPVENLRPRPRLPREPRPRRTVGGYGLRALARPRALLLGSGLLLRIALLLLLVPKIHTAWFVPFFEATLSSPSWDPWQTFLDAGGNSGAFPYGPVMVTWFGFWALLTSWLPGSWGIQLGIGLGVLVAELVLWRIVGGWRRESSRAAQALVALSPVVLYASYVHGQLDVVPAALMFAAAVLLRDRRWFAAGLLGGLAVAAKFSSALFPPLVLLFLLRNARFREHTGAFVAGLLPGLALTLLPVLLPGYREMVVLTPTSESVFAYAVDLGPGLTLVVLPVVYVALAGVLYRFKRGNPDLVVLIGGMMLTAVPLLTPAGPGWYVWSVPFLAVFAAWLGRQAVAAVWLFWAVATAALALRASAATWRGSADAISAEDFREVGNFVGDSAAGTTGAVLSTVTVVLGLLVLVMVFRRARPRLDMYRMSGSPLSVTIAGDSGTGKDTLCISLANVFGESATSFLMGDDYHLYDRKAPLWQVTTHLHPAANDLPTMNRDALQLMRGKPVWAVHYDHSRGRFTKQRPIRQRELVVVNGLHALTSAEVRRTADLSVFTSMDERLRRQLKINRDVGERGHSLSAVVASIERRYPHARQFIEPQADLADVVFRLEPVRPLPEEESVTSGPIPMSLLATLRGVSFGERLQRALISVGGCSAWIEYMDTPGAVRLVVHPEDLTPADTAGIARSLIERPEELFTDAPVWLGKSRGVMQLIVVLALLERRKDRPKP